MTELPTKNYLPTENEGRLIHSKRQPEKNDCRSAKQGEGARLYEYFGMEGV